MRDSYDVVIVGSGIGGGTLAHALASSGLSILIVERGGFLPKEPENADPKAVFVDHRYAAPDEIWVLNGRPTKPAAYYFVGGASKLFGAVMTRLRSEDFDELTFPEGLSPGWPITYEELAPFYNRAEELYGVHGGQGEDPTEPPHATSFPYGPIEHDPTVAKLVDSLKTRGLHPYHLPLSVMRHPGGPCIRCASCDGFPCRFDAKGDADICAVRPILSCANVELSIRTRAERFLLSADGRSIDSVVVNKEGDTRQIRAKLFVLAAGAINSAALLLRSAAGRFSRGLANSSNCVGRNYMAHNSSVLMAVRPLKTGITFQKTFGLNDFYFGDADYRFPMGNVQMIGKLQGAMLAAKLPFLPASLRQAIANRSLDWYAQSEDLPLAENRVWIDGSGSLHLDRRPSNLEPHRQLLRRVAKLMRGLGFPLVAIQRLGIRTTSHQCGTIRFGTDPAKDALDPLCRSYDHRNLFVADSSFFPSSGGVNPALTIAAQALRIADHMMKEDFNL
jgi:choline dehydrogenase-like flavoprotein